MPRILPARTYLIEGSKNGIFDTKTLVEVRNYLQRFTAVQDPKDFKRNLKDLHVDFQGKYLTANWKTPSGGETFLFKRKGISDAQSKILPPSFFSGLLKLSVLDAAGATLATSVWSKFAEQSLKNSLIRTVRTKLDDGTVVRVIRNCQSTAYAPYSNLKLVEDLLSHAQGFGKMPVLNWKLGDPGIRVRFACVDATVYALSSVDESILQTEPIPVIDAWNSETGQRKVGVGAGVYLLRNGAFIGATGRLGKEEWIHRGSAKRIRYGLQSKYSQMVAQAKKAVMDYTDATDIFFVDKEDVLNLTHSRKAQVAWLTRQMAGVSDKKKLEVFELLRKGNLVAPDLSLAACVEAIALLCVESVNVHLDPKTQQDVETLASTVLARGLMASETKTASDGKTINAITPH